MVRKRELEVFIGKILPALEIKRTEYGNCISYSIKKSIRISYGIKKSIRTILRMAVEHKVPKGILGLDEEMSEAYNSIKRDLRSKE